MMVPRVSLPIDQWPPADRLAWLAACEPSRRLQRGGAAGRLKPVSKRAYSSAYGLFLEYLRQRGKLDLRAPAGAHVVPENVEPYLEEFDTRVSSVTVYNNIQKLRRMTNMIAADRDTIWLSEIEKDLAFAMRPRSKTGRFVMSLVLADAGFAAMAEALRLELSPMERARRYRNGLMVALLAHVPIRLKNYAALELGRSLVKIKNSWWILLSKGETKENSPDDRPIEEPSLVAALELYLSEYRPVLAQSANPPPALWLSSRDGSPLSYSAVELTLNKVTKATTGVKVTPHLFRTAGVSTVAIGYPEKPNLGSALLHHKDPKVTFESYNRASTLAAGMKLQEIVKRYRST